MGRYMDRWEHRRQDLKDLSLVAMFFGSALTVTSFGLDVVFFPYEATPGAIQAAEYVGVAIGLLGAIGFVALNRRGSGPNEPW